MKITFIGGGNMAFAMIGGLCRQGGAANNITVIERLPEQREKIVREFGVRVLAKPDEAAIAADIIILAVKPQQMREAIVPLVGSLERQLVLSIAAGLPLATLSGWLAGFRRLIRAMPNTPALIGAGMTGLYALPEVQKEERDAAELVLRAVGEALWVEDEAEMDAITAISGSGPAYLFLFIESLEAAAGQLGFSADAARKLAIATTLGAARLAAAAEEPPALLRERVTSKGGTTAAALAVMAENKVSEGIIAGAMAARERSREMARQLAS
ncbi:MAG: pyrroline-5-carboxylate reductase [Betaproteobacteria bacterium]|nr:pyrroline-5-carboxylate reductase [Betaproteobacteria bacterium]